MTLPPSTSPSTLSPPPSLSPPFFGAPSSGTPGKTPTKQADGPSASEASNSGGSKKSQTKKKVVWISIAGVLSFIILVLALVLLIPKCSQHRRAADIFSKRHQIRAYQGDGENPPRDNGSLVQLTPQMQKGKYIFFTFYF